jgi:hypothetical protein
VARQDFGREHDRLADRVQDRRNDPDEQEPFPMDARRLPGIEPVSQEAHHLEREHGRDRPDEDRGQHHGRLHVGDAVRGEQHLGQEAAHEERGNR